MDDVYKSPGSSLERNNAEIKYAGFWTRFAASIIDSLWMLPLIFVLGYLYYGSNYVMSDKLYLGGVDIFIQYILPALITLAFWAYKSATPGKMAVRTKIVDAKTLEPASNSQLIVRYLCYYISMLVLFLGFIWVAFDKKKQGWHDKLAKTLVVHD